MAGVRSWAAPALLTLLGCVQFHCSAGIKFSKCEYRYVDSMEGLSGSYNLGVWHCTTDAELYVESAVDPTVRLRSHSTAAEVRTAIQGSSATFPPQSNFAATYQQGVGWPKQPIYLSAWTGNLKLKCGAKEVAQGGEFEPPINFLFTLPPTQNSLGKLWQAMGAKAYNEPLLANTVSFAFMHDGYEMDDNTGSRQNIVGTISKAEADACIAAGTMEVEVALNNPPWKFVDVNGNGLDTAPVAVQQRQLTCVKADFETFVDTRSTALFADLESASTRQEFEAGVMSYATLVANEVYQACEQILHRLYTTSTQTFRFKNTRHCSDPTDTTDPCCNEELRWSDCCLPQDHTVQISGLFDQANNQEIANSCPNNEAVVQELLSGALRTVLLSQKSPNSPCSGNNARIRIANDENEWDKFADPPRSCHDIIQSQKTISGQDSCNDASECYSGVCADDGDGVNKCSRPIGSGLVEPVLLCMLDKIDSDLWKFSAKELGLDPTVVNKAKSWNASQWQDAVTKFSQKVSLPTCSGPEAEVWCVVEGVTMAECQSLRESLAPWNRQMTWVADSTATDGGYCYITHPVTTTGPRPNMYMTNAEGLAKCQAVLQEWGNGACSDTQTVAYPPHTQAECTGQYHTWVDFTGKTVSFHRLGSAYVWTEGSEGEWSRQLMQGSQHKCELEKRCNWDPEGRVTGGIATKCESGQGLTDGSRAIYWPGSIYEEGGLKKACVVCWGSHCVPYWASKPPMCATMADASDNCAQSGGNGLGTVTPKDEIWNGDGGYRCRRDGLDTKSQCIDTTICPAPPQLTAEQARQGWHWECAEKFCYDPQSTEQTCSSNHDGAWWAGRWANGTGLCKVFQEAGQYIRDKTTCEASSLTWFEGRIFREGFFDSSATCDQYCDDGTWPPKRTCDGQTDGRCSASCPQCEGDEHYSNGICVAPSAQSKQDCATLQDFEWSEEHQVCYRRDLTTQSACTALDSSYTFHTCSGQGRGNCPAYCHDTLTTDADTCWQSSKRWIWHEEKCAYHRWQVARPTSQACSSLNANTCDSEAGCYWEMGSCQGTSYGCDQRSGGQWVSGTTQDAVYRSLLGCEWREWARCKNKGTCENSGRCEDWYLPACIIDFVAEDGYQKSCEELGDLGGTAPQGTKFTWADRMGCLALTSSGAHVDQAGCSSIPNGVWKTRAEGRTECEGHGDICTGKFQEWDILDGFTRRQDCEGKCDHKWRKKATWQPGHWNEVAAKTLHWRTREVAQVNTWENGFSPQLYWDFIQQSLSSMVGEAQKQRIYCLSLLTDYVPIIADLCTGQGAAPTTTQVIESTVASASVTCNELQQQEPISNYEAIVNFAAALCEGGNAQTTALLRRRTVVGARVRRLGADDRRLTSSPCAVHEVILTDSGLLAGQKVGGAIGVQGVNNAQLCLNPTVPTNERCSDNTIKDIVEVSASGEYGNPLGLTVTEDSSGYYCFDGAQSGVTYVPVLLKQTPVQNTMTTTGAAGATTTEVTGTSKAMQWALPSWLLAALALALLH